MTVVTREQFSPFAETTTTADPGSGGTSLAVTTRTPFPAVAPFRLLVQNGEGDPTNRELMYATAGVGTGAGSFTVTRGLEGTTGVAHPIGSYVRQVVTAKAIERHVNDHPQLALHNELYGMTVDPMIPGAVVQFTTLVPIIAKIYVPETLTFANVILYKNAASTGQVAGGNQAGIYLSTGVRIGASTAATTLTALGTLGLKTLALTVDGGQSLTVTGGPGVFVWVAVLETATVVGLTAGNGAGLGQVASLLSISLARCGTLPAVSSGSGLSTSFDPNADITFFNQMPFYGLT
jgi:hypothetical protein